MPAVTRLAAARPAAPRLAGLRLAGPGQPERDRSRRVPGRVIHHYLDAGQLQGRAVGQLGHLVRLGEGQAAQQGGARLRPEPARRVAEQPAVRRVDVGGDVLRAADRDHRPDVVNVAVGEQDGGRLQPVPLEDLLDARLGVLAGIHDQALLARPGGQHVAVRGERAGRESGDQHGGPPPGWCPAGYRTLVQATERAGPQRRWPVRSRRGGRSGLRGAGWRARGPAAPLPASFGSIFEPIAADSGALRWRRNDGLGSNR